MGSDSILSQRTPDGRVRSSAKPPFELADHRRMITAQLLGEPKPENIFEFFSRHQYTPTLPSNK
jgi:hypothetical protein